VSSLLGEFILGTDVLGGSECGLLGTFVLGLSALGCPPPPSDLDTLTVSGPTQEPFTVIRGPFGRQS
jgi:hypothetical protein